MKAVFLAITWKCTRNTLCPCRVVCRTRPRSRGGVSTTPKFDGQPLKFRRAGSCSSRRRRRLRHGLGGGDRSAARRRRRVSSCAARVNLPPRQRSADRRRSFLAPSPKKRGPPASLPCTRAWLLCAKRSCASPYLRTYVKLQSHTTRAQLYFRNI